METSTKLNTQRANTLVGICIFICFTNQRRESNSSYFKNYSYLPLESQSSSNYNKYYNFCNFNLFSQFYILNRFTNCYVQVQQPNGEKMPRDCFLLKFSFKYPCLLNLLPRDLDGLFLSIASFMSEITCGYFNVSKARNPSFLLSA